MALIELHPVAGPLPKNPAMGWAIYNDQDWALIHWLWVEEILANENTTD